MCDVITVYQPCCGKVFCYGCALAETKEMDKGNIKGLCSFCRVPLARTDKERMKQCKKRLKLNEAESFYTLGSKYREGNWGLSKDMSKAIELWNKAADLGSVSAHHSLGVAYSIGDGVKKNVLQTIHYMKLAAMGGHEMARYQLGMIEKDYCNTERAMKHLMIAAQSEEKKSLKEIGEGYKAGHVTKEEYANALRAYKDSCDEMKSGQREAAKLHRHVQDHRSR